MVWTHTTLAPPGCPARPAPRTEQGLKPVGLKIARPSRRLLEQHFDRLRRLLTARSFASLLAHMESGPVACMVWEGAGVVDVARVMLGAPPPPTAIYESSESLSAAAREVALWFPQGEGLCRWTHHRAAWVYDVPAAPCDAARGGGSRSAAGQSVQPAESETRLAPSRESEGSAVAEAKRFFDDAVGQELRRWGRMGGGVCAQLEVLEQLAAGALDRLQLERVEVVGPIDCGQVSLYLQVPPGGRRRSLASCSCGLHRAAPRRTALRRARAHALCSRAARVRPARRAQEESLFGGSTEQQGPAPAAFQVRADTCESRRVTCRRVTPARRFSPRADPHRPATWCAR